MNCFDENTGTGICHDDCDGCQPTQGAPMPADYDKTEIVEKLNRSYAGYDI